MSRPPHPEDPPNVYVPRVDQSPDYEEYPDPAVAHGWQNAYDETSELPRIPEGRDASGPEYGGRTARRSRRRRDNRRRAMMAAGALGTVSVAALVAGFAFSSGSSGDSDGKHEPARSVTEASLPTGPMTDPATTSAPSSGGSDATASPEASEPSATSPDPKPTTASPTATTQAPTDPETTRPGRGQGTTKKPK
ncbi:hypothetical protein [Streptomyces sp. NPDC003635]